MKYVIVILGGAADLPQPDLDGQTPLQYAKPATLQALAEVGRLGEVQFIPGDARPPVPPGPDAALLAMLGYKPQRRYPGHALLHALGLGLPVKSGDWCFELSLISIVDGLIQPTDAVRITEGEAQAMTRGLLSTLDLPGAVVHPGQSDRPGTPAHLLIDPAAGGAASDWSEVVTHRPDDIAGLPLRKALPVGGRAGERLQHLIDASHAYLADHELNRARAEMGEPAITHLWPWGQGTRPPADKPIKPWTPRYGKSAVVISRDPALRGVARFVGIDTRLPEGPAAPDTLASSGPPKPQAAHAPRAVLAALGAAAVSAIEHYDLTIVHTPAPQQAAHDAGPRGKADAIALADTHLLRPIVQALKASDQPHRLLVTPLHTTCVNERREALGPVPFLVAGHKITNVVPRPMTEPAAAQADLRVPFGDELMEFLLRSGIR